MVPTLQSVYDILTLTVEIIHINYFVAVADCCSAYVSINQSTVERREGTLLFPGCYFPAPPNSPGVTHRQPRHN